MDSLDQLTESENVALCLARGGDGMLLTSIQRGK